MCVTDFINWVFVQFSAKMSPHGHQKKKKKSSQYPPIMFTDSTSIVVVTFNQQLSSSGYDSCN